MSRPTFSGSADKVWLADKPQISQTPSIWYAFVKAILAANEQIDQRRAERLIEKPSEIATVIKKS